MDPDGLDDDQMTRLLALGLAVFWTARDGGSYNTREVTTFADDFTAYIQTGKRP